MKKTFLFAILLGLCCIGKAQWSQGFYFTQNLTLIEQVFFSSPTLGYAAVTANGGPGSGYILKSVDGGINWTLNYTATLGAVNDVHFPSNQTTIGYASGAYVYKTTNGGTSWDTVYTPTESIGRIYFTSTTEGFMTGELSVGLLLKTTDGGDTWSPITMPGFRPHEIQFLSSTVGYIAGGDVFSGGDGGIAKTTDGGNTWQELDYKPALGGNPTGGFDGMFWLDANNGFVGGTNGIMVKTTDGGQNWSQVPIAVTDSSIIMDIWFTSSAVGYFCTISGNIFTTVNGGATWTLNGTNQGGSALYCLEFADANKGFAGGVLGTFLYTTNGGGSVAISPQSLQDMVIHVAPNPSNGNFHLNLSEDVASPVSLQLVDCKGRMVSETKMAAWELRNGYDLQLVAPNGVYLLMIEAGNSRTSMRVVIQN